MSADRKGIVQILQEFSLPLIGGVVAALAFANLAPHLYERIVEGNWGGSLLGHELDLHFVINDLFMVFFFGIAAKEIVEACLPGGTSIRSARRRSPSRSSASWSSRPA